MSGAASDGLILRAYVRAAEHGMAMPLYATPGKPNAWYRAAAAVPGDRESPIAGFEVFEPEEVVELPEEAWVATTPGDPWRAVFLWNGQAYVGDAAALWTALTPFRAEILESAPISFLDACPHDEAPLRAKAARAAYAYLAGRFGQPVANQWRLDSFVFGEGKLVLTRALERDLTVEERLWLQAMARAVVRGSPAPEAPPAGVAEAVATAVEAAFRAALGVFEAEAAPAAAAGPAPIELPEGWEMVTAAGLAERLAQRPSAREMSDWFNGHIARWEVALAQGVRPRKAVEDLVRLYEAALDKGPQPLVRLLSGAGGEGKSTALLQVAGALVGGAQDWTCVWRTSATASLDEAFFSRLERRPNHAWIVAIDDAENIAERLPPALKRIQPRTDVHLVLAARHADWAIHRLSDRLWDGAAAFSRVTLAGLNDEDARRIVDGWAAYGEEAMGRLRSATPEDAARTLLGHAQEHAARPDEGALLGALLITREGEHYKDRVVRLMQPLRGAEGVGGRSLLDIYAMIAAMHAENQLYLSQSVLAFALGCSEEELERGPLRTLRSEAMDAMVDTGATYVLTRHRIIAQAAVRWLIENDGYDIDALYPRLAVAGLRHFLTRRPATHDVARWCNELPFHFVDRRRGRGGLAVAIARALYEADANDPVRLVTYASTVRRAQGAPEALALFRREGPKFARDRGVLYEWSVAAGASGDDGLDVWLAARSVADDRNVQLRDRQIMMSMAGLGLAFEHLQKAGVEGRHAIGRAAAGRLGLRLPDLDATSMGYFRKYVTADPARDPARPGAVTPSIDEDLAILHAAVISASLNNDPANDDPPLFEALLGEPDGYRFTMLKSALLARDRGR